MIKQLILASLCHSGMVIDMASQVCDPGTAPSGLTSTYTPGSGVLLEWDVVPGSMGIQIQVILPTGYMLTKRLGIYELDQFFVPEAALSTGSYTWRVQSACNAIPPFSVTPPSATSSFVVGGISSCPATVTDIDGNVYNTIVIGSQCWMQQNLQVEHYSNGDVVPTGLSEIAWSNTTEGAYAVYDNEIANKPTYGLLYNWYALDDVRGLCPTGWHVPSDAEWTQLITVLDPGTCGSCTGSSHSSSAGGHLKDTGTLSAGTGLWQAPNAAATNSSGYSGLPGGHIDVDGLFNFQGNFGYWWSSSAFTTNFAWTRSLGFGFGDALRYTNDWHYGFSVRCIQN